MAVGDRGGGVGWGWGTAKEVRVGVKMHRHDGRRKLIEVPLQGGTIPHEITVTHGSSTIVLRSAAAGTGVIAGAVPRAILELAGITDILTKELGSRNSVNIAYATLEALRQLQTWQDVKRLRKSDKPEVAVSGEVA